MQERIISLSKKRIVWQSLSFLLAIALTFMVLLFILQENETSFGNKQAMQNICNDAGGEPYIFKIGWSDECGFDVYRGACVQFGWVVPDVDVILIDGTVFSAEVIGTMFVLDEGLSDEEYMEIWNMWEDDVCELFSGARRN